VDESKQNIEADSEANSPVEFNLVLLWDVDTLSKSSVLISAGLLDQAFVSYFNILHRLHISWGRLSDALEAGLLFLVSGLNC
jgi:hypothetical protein